MLNRKVLFYCVCAAVLGAIFVFQYLLLSFKLRAVSCTGLNCRQIANIISIQRKIIDKELPNASRLLLENGGRPMRSVIISTWRSGSNFLGEILNHTIGNFYHYEPLTNYVNSNIGEPALNPAAIVHIKKLLHCDYTDMVDYSNNFTRSDLFYQNTKLWNKNYLFGSFKFIEQWCTVFPFQSMKVLGIRLALAEQLLADARYGQFRYCVSSSRR